MKKKMLIISFVFIFFTIPPLYSQTTAPDPPSPGSTGDSSGGGAPIGSGLFIMLGLGAAYVGKKIYQYRQQAPDD